jgi:hypothetical protein
MALSPNFGRSTVGLSGITPTLEILIHRLQFVEPRLVTSIDDLSSEDFLDKFKILR